MGIGAVFHSSITVSTDPVWQKNTGEATNCSPAAMVQENLLSGP